MDLARRGFLLVGLDQLSLKNQECILLTDCLGRLVFVCLLLFVLTGCSSGLASLVM